MKNRLLDAKISKTVELQNEEMQDTESDHDSSVCRVFRKVKLLIAVMVLRT